MVCTFLLGTSCAPGRLRRPTSSPQVMAMCALTESTVFKACIELADTLPASLVVRDSYRHRGHYCWLVPSGESMGTEAHPALHRGEANSRC